MQYRKINVDLIVLADEADAVVAELNATLDRMEESHTLFGGGNEVVAFEHTGIRRRSALEHTIAAGKTAGEEVKTAREHVTSALHLVI